MKQLTARNPISDGTLAELLHGLPPADFRLAVAQIADIVYVERELRDPIAARTLRVGMHVRGRAGGHGDVVGVIAQVNGYSVDVRPDEESAAAGHRGLRRVRASLVEVLR